MSPIEKKKDGTTCCDTGNGTDDNKEGISDEAKLEAVMGEGFSDEIEEYKDYADRIASSEGTTAQNIAEDFGLTDIKLGDTSKTNTEEGQETEKPRKAEEIILSKLEEDELLKELKRLMIERCVWDLSLLQLRTKMNAIITIGQLKCFDLLKDHTEEIFKDRNLEYLVEEVDKLGGGGLGIDIDDIRDIKVVLSFLLSNSRESRAKEYAQIIVEDYEIKNLFICPNPDDITYPETNPDFKIFD